MIPQSSTAAAENRRRLIIVAVILASLILLLLLNKWMISVSLAPEKAASETPSLAAQDSDAGKPEGVIDYMQDPKGAAELVSQLARQTGGDFDKLTSGQQRMLNAMAGGHGRDMLRMRARELASPVAKTK